MSRLAFVFGLVISLGLHTLLFIGGGTTPSRLSTKVEPETPVAAKVTFSPSPEPKQPESPKPSPAREKTPPPAAPAKATLAKAPEPVVKPASPSEVGAGLGDLSDSTSADSLPELRLTWESVDQLLTVARALGFRLLAVNSGNQPVGELSLGDSITLKRFRGNLEGFSNRVRSLPAHFFGPEPLLQASEPVKCFWILVPASIDINWVRIEMQAVQARGLQNYQVSYVEARIIPTENGYDLEIVNVVTT